MKLFQIIVFGTLSIITSSLHAQYPEFNVGENINTCILSPNKKFLLITGYSLAPTKLYNLETGQLHCELEWYEQPFFSQDSKSVYGVKGNEIKEYIITPDNVIKIFSITLTSRDFAPDGETAYMHVNNEFIKLNSYKNSQPGVFISRVLQNENNIRTKKLNQKRLNFFIHSIRACTISQDGNYAAVASPASSGSAVHVINLKTYRITHSYQFSSTIWTLKRPRLKSHGIRLVVN